MRKANGDLYPPNTLYQLVCGLQRNLHVYGRADIKLFDNPAFHGFCITLDGEMKRLIATGNYTNKNQAEPITQEQENHLWELYRGLLGDDNVLLNTTVYQVGFLFLDLVVEMNADGSGIHHHRSSFLNHQESEHI